MLGFFKKYPITCEGIWGDTMSVTFCSICDNNCDFCIARETLPENRKLNRDISAMVETVKELKPTMMEISGGEPFLFMDDLEFFLNEVRPIVPSIRIFTSLPKTISDNWEQFLRIYEKLDCVICSYQHYDYRLNNFLYHANSNHNRLEILGRILDLNPDKVRVNMNLIRYGFDCKLEIDRGLAYLKMLGAKNVRINELMSADEEYVDFQKEYGIRFPSPFLYGCCRPVKLRKFKGMNITVKVSCFRVCGWHNPSRREYKVMIKRVNDPGREKRFAYVLKEDGSYTHGF